MSAKRTKPRIGRPPTKYKSHRHKQQAQQEAARTYQEGYLEVRRKRYAADADYRTKIVQRQRDNYRAGNPGFVPKGFGKHAGRATKFADDYGTKTETIRGLEVAAMATVINIVPKVLHGWINDGKFPAPPIKTLCGRPIYTVAQADVLATTLKTHLEGMSAFRSSNKPLIEALHKAIA